MGNRYCWLVGGGLRNSQAYESKDKPVRQIPALFLPKNPVSNPAVDKTVKLG